MIEQASSISAYTRPIVISDREMSTVSELIYAQCGINLSPAKKSMVVARLGKRLRALGYGSFKDYLEFVGTPKGREEELTRLIDLITTNTTEFFRESKHFDYLVSQTLPTLISTGRFTRSRHINIWSAGCSSGEEPYTLAMVLADFFEGREGSFSILATDISTRVLHKAKLGIYDEDSMRAISSTLRHKYVMKGKGEQRGRCRIVPELREKITFAKLNFMEDSFNLPQPMDIIFCRNVIIYFDHKTKSELIGKFYDNLIPGGFFFTGHSETLNGLNDQFVLVSPTIYKKPR